MISLIWAFLIANWEVIAGVSIPVLFELIFRRVPTEKDWSIINLIKRLVDFIIKNRGKHGQIH